MTTVDHKPPETTPAEFLAALSMVLKYTSETLPQGTRAEVRDALAGMEARGITPQQATEIVASGLIPAVPAPRTAADGAKACSTCGHPESAHDEFGECQAVTDDGPCWGICGAAA